MLIAFSKFHAVLETSLSHLGVFADPTREHSVYNLQSSIEFLKFVKGVANFTFNVLTKPNYYHKNNWEGLLGGTGYVHSLEGEDGFMDVYSLPNSSRCIH
jgi:hypothetical protein